MYLIQAVQTSWRSQLPPPNKEQQSSNESICEVKKQTANCNSNNNNKMERLHHFSSSQYAKKDNDATSGANGARNKKWSLGRFFRKKKNIDMDSSSEDDRKAGFITTPQKNPRANNNQSSSTKLKNQSKRSSKVGGFDHIVEQPTRHGTAVSSNATGIPAVPRRPATQQHIRNEYFLPVEVVSLNDTYSQNQRLLCPGQDQQQFSRSANSLDRRSGRGAYKSRSLQRHPQGLAVPHHSSSEEELISLNSSTFSKFHSDESMHSSGPGQTPQSRRSRAARNERYYKRLSRDGEVSQLQPAPQVMHANQPAQRWKTQPAPLSIYNEAATRPNAPQMVPSHQGSTMQRLRYSNSLQHVAPAQYTRWGQLPQRQQAVKNLQNSVNDTKRSISYDSHIHLQNTSGRKEVKLLPPPPPPRDPLRRVTIGGPKQNDSAGDLRPQSCAFDQNGLPVLPHHGMNPRCVSADDIWPAPYTHTHNVPVSLIQRKNQHHAQDLQASHGRRFITRAERDLQLGKKSLPNGLNLQYVADASPRSRKPIHLLDQESNQPASSGIVRTTKSGLPLAVPKPEVTAQKTAADEQVCYARPAYAQRDPAHVICGSLQIKPSADPASHYAEVIHKEHRNVHKTQSAPTPNTYSKQRSADVNVAPNKYEEYVAEKREKHHKPIFTEPTQPAPPPPIYFPRKKPANLEEAITELENIYKSLGLAEPCPDKPAKPFDDFDKFALSHADEYDEEDSPAGDPDPVRDDVAYRNMQLANLQHKTVDKQPPFGIPIGPIVPSPHSDYLHVTPNTQQHTKFIHKPDVVKDDLAVRTLRKDQPGTKEKFSYPSSALQKKNRALRTQSANIYSLIQRNAAKPSGGDYLSYMELTRSIDRAGSMSDLNKTEDSSDIPATLTFLRNLREQEQEAHKKASIPFRHPSQAGAICQLPEKLEKLSSHGKSADQPASAPVPLPRKSLTPEPTSSNHKIEEVLNKIAQDAQESSAKLSMELQELRKEALITASRAKRNPEEEKLEQELQEIEAVSEAAKRCGKMLLDTLPDVDAPRPKVHKDGKQLLQAIDQVSEAANAVCEKILKDIGSGEPPAVPAPVPAPAPPPTPVSVPPKQSKVLEPEQATAKPKPFFESLVMPNLIKKLDPIQSEKIEGIAKRCMRQISELAAVEDPNYDNLTPCEMRVVHAVDACNTTVNTGPTHKFDKPISTVPEPNHKQVEEIDIIMAECEKQSREQASKVPLEPPAMTPTSSHLSVTTGSEGKTSSSGGMVTSSSSSNNVEVINAVPTSSTTASSFSSSSDCLPKFSSPSISRRQSSSITSFNPYSSSDYIKSPSSEYHAPSTDPIKTFSTTSYDLQSTSATPNITTNSTFSYSPSPPLNLTPVTGRTRTPCSSTMTGKQPSSNIDPDNNSSSVSQYNSSEELAIIFGIEEKRRRSKSSSADKPLPPTVIEELEQQQQLQQQQQQQKHTLTGNVGVINTSTKTTTTTTTITTTTTTTSITNNNHTITSTHSAYVLPPLPTFYNSMLVVDPVRSTNPNANAASINSTFSLPFVDAHAFTNSTTSPDNASSKICKQLTKATENVSATEVRTDRDNLTNNVSLSLQKQVILNITASDVLKDDEVQLYSKVVEILAAPANVKTNKEIKILNEEILKVDDINPTNEKMFTVSKIKEEVSKINELHEAPLQFKEQSEELQSVEEYNKKLFIVKESGDEMPKVQELVKEMSLVQKIKENLPPVVEDMAKVEKPNEKNPRIQESIEEITKSTEAKATLLKVEALHEEMPTAPKLNEKITNVEENNTEWSKNGVMNIEEMTKVHEINEEISKNSSLNGAITVKERNHQIPVVQVLNEVNSKISGNNEKLTMFSVEKEKTMKQTPKSVELQEEMTKPEFLNKKNRDNKRFAEKMHSIEEINDKMLLYKETNGEMHKKTCDSERIDEKVHSLEEINHEMLHCKETNGKMPYVHEKHQKINTFEELQREMCPDLKLKKKKFTEEEQKFKAVNEEHPKIAGSNEETTSVIGMKEKMPFVSDLCETIQSVPDSIPTLPFDTMDLVDFSTVKDPFKKNVVFETPKLNIRISEIRHNFQLSDKKHDETVKIYDEQLNEIQADFNDTHTEKNGARNDFQEQKLNEEINKEKVLQPNVAVNSSQLSTIVMQKILDEDQFFEAQTEVMLDSSKFGDDNLNATETSEVLNDIRLNEVAVQSANYGFQFTDLSTQAKNRKFNNFETERRNFWNEFGENLLSEDNNEQAASDEINNVEAHRADFDEAALDYFKLNEKATTVSETELGEYSFQTERNPTNEVDNILTYDDAQFVYNTDAEDYQLQCYGEQATNNNIEAARISSLQETLSNDNSNNNQEPSDAPEAGETPGTSTQHNSNGSQNQKAAGAVSLLGESRVAVDGLTSLEQLILMICSLGVISSNDFFTFFSILIGVIIVVLIVFI